jgi:VRR-NUC domain.
MSQANKITKELLDEIPKQFPHIRVWRSNRVKAMAVGRGGKPRMIDAGIDGQGDISGIIAPTGKRLEIEVKAGDDRLSEDQEKFRDMIRYHGGVYIEARDVERTLDQLARVLPAVTIQGYGDALKAVAWERE